MGRVQGGSRESFQEGALPTSPKTQGRCLLLEEGSLVSTRHWVPGSNTNQGKDRHVRSTRVCKGQDGPSKHGERLSAIPLPALSMTRAQAAHDHFLNAGREGQ